MAKRMVIIVCAINNGESEPDMAFNNALDAREYEKTLREKGLETKVYRIELK